MLGLVAISLVVVVLGVLADDGGSGQPITRRVPSPQPTTECDTRMPPEPSPRSYASPEQVLEPGVDYAAVVHTSCGDIEIDLLEKQAPATVNNFVFLAREGFYDGLIWHRIERNSVIQTGDPNGLWGQPPEGPGYTLEVEDEAPRRARAYDYGTVAMAAETLPNQIGSQWFIVVHQNEPVGYNKFYPIFGEVREDSYTTLDRIERQRTRGGAAETIAEAVRPIIPIYIYSIEIVEH